MIDDTNAAKSGGAQPCSFESSVWMNTSPVNGWFGRSTGPCMWTPHSRQAWRRMSALGSTTFSFSPFLVTVTLSFGTTATCENADPFGFQHFVHPQTWLYEQFAEMTTSTGLLAHRQRSVAPEKSFAPGFSPLS